LAARAADFGTAFFPGGDTPDILGPEDLYAAAQLQYAPQPRLHHVGGIALGQPMQQYAFDHDIAVGVVLGQKQTWAFTRQIVPPLDDDAMVQQQGSARQASTASEGVDALDGEIRRLFRHGLQNGPCAKKRRAKPQK
jgi:hypothetical protein